MRAFGIITACVLGVLLLFAVIFGIAWISATNREVDLRNRAAAQAKENEAVFDTMIKIIAGKAEVSDEYRNAFKEIYPQIINGRYNDKNLLFKFVQEHNPTFDTSLYKQVSISIEAERKKFLLGQAKLIDIKREHDNLRQKFPSSFFVGSRPEIAINIITSDKAEDVFRTGHDNDAAVFDRNRKKQ